MKDDSCHDRQGFDAGRSGEKLKLGPLGPPSPPLQSCPEQLYVNDLRSGARE